MDTDDRRSRVVETASGTTDPDNARSGGFAYVVALLAVAVSLGLGSGLGGCVDLAARVGADYAAHRVTGLGLPDDEGKDDGDGRLDDGTGSDDGLGGERSDTGSTAPHTIEDLIGEDLAMFGYTIDFRLSASAYANARKDVSAFARELAVIDRDASSELATTLRNAAWGPSALDEALGEGSRKADQTLEALRALEVPEVEGDGAKQIAKDLEDARDEAAERWEAIADELALMARSESLSERDLADYERDIKDAADAAARKLAEALAASAER